VRVTRFGLLLVGGVFCTLAVFLLAGAFFVAGGLAAAGGLFLIGWAGLQKRLYLELPGTVVARRVAEFGGIRELWLRIAAEEPGVHVDWRGITDQEPPALGDRVPLMIPMHRRPHRAYALIGRTGRQASGPVLMLAGRRIAFARPHRLLFGRAAWAGRTAEQALDLTAELVSEAVLDWHRARCKRIAEPLKNSPEFLSLSAAFDSRWDTVVDRALQKQAEPFNDGLFDDTAASRALVLRRLAPLPLLAVAAGLLAVFAVPGLVKTAWAALESLRAGTIEPFRDTVHWSAAVHASGLPELDLYVLLGCAAVVTATVAWSAIRTAAAAVSAYHAWRADLTGVVRQRLFDEYRQVANAQDPPVLQIRTAPGLAAPASDQVIARSEADQLRAFAFDLGAGAVAISGSRGVGKSTLLAALTGSQQSSTLGLVVSAPVRYDSRDFLLHLYAQLCDLVLDRLGDRRAYGRLRRLVAYARRAVATLLRTAAVLCLLGVLFTGTRQWLTGHLPLPQLAGTWFLTGLTLIITSAWIRGPLPARELALAAEASRRLRQTRYLQTVSSESSGGLGQSSAQLSWRRARQWAEQPHTLPDVVQSYRQFATDVALWWRAETGGRGKLMVGIDEADRIAEPEAAENFVNEIKSVFGIPHCVYLVSVSEEALANFERRVVRIRTVFDSAFDHVILLRPLQLRESLELLRQRVPGVPDRLWVFCHCLSGGMPRDVLRTARTMFEVHRNSNGPSSVPDLAERLVAREVQTIKRGFQMQPGEPDHQLGELLADVAWPGTTCADLRNAAERQLAGGSVAAASIGAALLYYATVLELFTDRADLLDEPGESTIIADLARVHSILGFDPPVAVQQLRVVQAYLD
jgi:hypothetical protein